MSTGKARRTARRERRPRVPPRWFVRLAWYAHRCLYRVTGGRVGLGVRFGEMAALRVSRRDLRRQRAVIAESVTPLSGQGMVWGTTKSHRRREVPIAQFIEELRAM